MVSRGGRSKGCTQCRRRRVKCDERRPICGQCVKRGLSCDGPRDLTWIDQSATFQNEAAPPGTLTRTSGPIQLSLTGFEEVICLAFTRKNLLRGGSVELACDMVDFEAGATRFTDPGLGLLRRSILSLAVTFFGSQHHQDHIINKGYSQYGDVLQTLNSHLACPELQLTNETLLTALSCMLLEIFLPTGPTNFLKHQRGLDAIAMLRGPPLEPEGTSATIFRGLRILSIVGCLAESRASMYAREEWKPVPLAPISEVALFQHHIFSVLADCTCLISQRNALRASRAPAERYEPLLASLHQTFNDLEALHPHWEALNRRQLGEGKYESDIAEALGVSDHVSATAYILYNTACICILQIQDSLFPSTTNIALRNAAAAKIAQCLEFKAHEQRKGAPKSNTIAFVATKVTWQALGRFNSPEGRRLAHVVECVTSAVFQQPHASQVERCKPPTFNTCSRRPAYGKDASGCIYQ